MPLVLGIQPIRGAGTGVSTYSRVLQQALKMAGVNSELIDEGSAEAAPSRAIRWLRASRPWHRHADRSSGRISLPDLYREAQVFFDIHGRLMEITCGGPSGIVHWTYPVPIRLSGWRNVYTIHDMIPLTDPDLTPIDPRRYRRMLTAILAKADRLVTVSEASKADIVRIFECRPGFVVNLGQAGDPAPPGPLPKPLQTGRYFLHCGTIEPRKNLTRLVSAHAESGVTMPLVFAGPSGWRSEAILEAIAESQHLIHLHYLPANQLSAAIAGARALIMPSLAEGFGLPVVEAMQLGTAIIASDRGALAEIARGAALPIDPESVESIASAIRLLAEDDFLYRDLRHRATVSAQTYAISPYGERLKDFFRQFAP